MVVEEVIHQDLAVLEDRHASVHELVQQQLGFVHADAHHVISKDGKPVKRGARHQLADLVRFPVSHYLYVCAVPQVFHRLAKHQIVYQLAEVRFKIAFCLLAELRVHPDVWLHPGLLIKLYHSVHLFQPHPLTEIELQAVVMDHLLFFVLQRHTSFSVFGMVKSRPAISRRWYSDICSGLIAFFSGASG